MRHAWSACAVALCMLFGTGNAAVPNSKFVPVEFPDESAPDYALDNAPLPKQVRQEIERVVDVTNPPISADGYHREEKPRIEFLSFAINRSRQFVVYLGKDGEGNKDIWIFRQVGDHAATLMDDADGSMFVTERPVRYGMHDLGMFLNGGGGTGRTEVFQFDGKKYRSAYCYEIRRVGDNLEGWREPHHPCKH
jgi:hypothetical protein